MENILPLSPGLGQVKLHTLTCENRKIRHENEFKKLTNSFLRCRSLRSIEWYQKHLCKSRETIPLKVLSSKPGPTSQDAKPLV
jgi:hypothetical protein